MSTVNAAGYLAGALMTPLLMRRLGTAAVLLWGSALASVFMALSGFFIEAHPLLLQRFLAGVASAYVFISGGLLAARIGSRVPRQAGLVLGIYYGGGGTGIALSTLAIPLLLAAARSAPHGWRWAWWGLALLCVLATLVLLWPARLLPERELSTQAGQVKKADLTKKLPWLAMAPMLAGYTLFGVATSAT